MYSAKMDKYAQKHAHTYKQEHKVIFDSITRIDAQFKKERTDMKVAKIIETIDTAPAQNVYKCRQGQTLTPLLEGKIQFGKLLKSHNLDAVRDEVTARGIVFLPTTNWTSLLKIIKENEGNNKFFKPLTDYTNFKWNDSHF